MEDCSSLRNSPQKSGFLNWSKSFYEPNDHTNNRTHTAPNNLMQMVYQSIAAYFKDNCANELTNAPIMTTNLEKDVLFSQLTLSRFGNRMDKDTLAQFDEIDKKMHEIVYSIRHPELVLFDLDSTLLNTYGHQEGKVINYHYPAHGYHPLFCFNELTGDPLKAELQDGTQYYSKDTDRFMIPLMQEYQEKYPSLSIYLRDESDFAFPDLYEACEYNDCKHTIYLKDNQVLQKYRTTRNKQINYAMEYREFMYQVFHPRRIVFKIEKPTNQLMHRFMFIITTMEIEPYQIIQ